MRKDFDDCVDLIKANKIKEFVKKALALAPKEFWEAPSSNSGKYHPPENQVAGGIIVHSRKLVRVALDLFRFFKIEDQLAEDKIIAACILHDIQKHGIPWGSRTIYEHGHVAADWLTDIAMTMARDAPAENKASVGIDGDLRDIISLVREHMAIWNKPRSTPALGVGQCLTLHSVYHLIVQLADYWASRKWCPFVCDDFGDLSSF